ncbi:MAG: hypothetical protein BroJett020_18330 [Bacteroidota bacterium]|nr:hypothetical protein [Flavobacteriales bacterium]WKZ76109.1 MAG: hypothetical protein QY303_04270 [Vicingaceae bacterium]GIK70538.1 MAG: hypothetical protein BroJett020_18330 [Bacteroidota bacterium]
MKHLIFTLALVATASLTNAQKLIDGYLTLKNPRGDNNIVGKSCINETFNGKGTPSITRYPGLKDMSSKKQNDFKAEIEANVQKVVEAKLGLTNSSIKISNLTGLEIIECNDFSKIDGLDAGNDYVISAVVVKEFQIERTNVNDVTVQAKLDSLLTKNVLDANLTIENKNDRKVVKSGTDLIVAVKFLKVTSKTPYDIPCNNCPIKIVRDNSVKQFDQTTKGNVNISFMDMDPMDITTFTTDELLKENQGCFFINVQHTGLTNGDGTFQENKLIICPSCANMSGTLIPNCDDYRPITVFIPTNERILFGKVLNKKEIANYSVSVKNLKVTYIKAPKNGDKKSNYRIGTVTGDVYMSKRIYKFKVAK